MKTKIKSVYCQGEDAETTLNEGYCECCLSKLKDKYDLDRFGNCEIYGLHDENGLYGFVCEECIESKKW